MYVRINFQVFCQALPDFEIGIASHSDFEVVGDGQYINTVRKISLAADVLLKGRRCCSATVYLPIEARNDQECCSYLFNVRLKDVRLERSCK